MKKLMTLTLQAVMMVMMMACNNTSQKGSTEENGTNVSEQTKLLQIDDVLTSGEALAETEITIEGVCTHICKHGGRKIFLMGSDDTQTLRIESGKIGKFDAACVNSLVKVTGILKEQRIDEAYLQRWEEQVKAQTDEKHGKDEEAGCDTEKKARGETSNSTEDRIADFRTKIAKREAESGKAYLTFFHVEATSYEIQ